MDKKIMVLFIDENVIDSFVNQKIFESIGIKNSISVCEYSMATDFLLNTKIIPDYIFIDVDIPMRNGFEFYSKIKNGDLPLDNTLFFFLSNSINPVDRITAETLGVKFIDKPLSIDKLKKHVLLN